MIEIRNLAISLDAGLADPRGAEELSQTVARRLRIGRNAVGAVAISKRSVDARRKANVHFVVTVRVALADPGAERALVSSLADRDIAVWVPAEESAIVALASPPSLRPVVVGTGPAGLFAALTLARAGANPLVIERGRPVPERVRAWEEFVVSGELDPESNIQFGEGGAGTFSDGKLTTNTKDPRTRSVIESLAAAGAPEEILWQAKPHVGTDRLRNAVVTLRREIESLGGEVRFRTALTDLVLNGGGSLTGIVTDGERGREEIAVTSLILAAGHSARDTFEMLERTGVSMVQKPFSIGVRIEHEQRLIDRAQYGVSAGHPALGAAEYKLSEHLPGGRTAYTFCMCPGGEVVASASEPGGVVTNGMSNFSRGGTNANAALLVNVGPGDFGSDHVLAGVEFQRRWERAAFEVGGRDFSAPAQLVGDFLRRQPSTAAGAVSPTYSRGVRWTDLTPCLPDYVIGSLRQAIPVFDQRLRGFGAADAVLTGVETRSSSPVRILRDDSMQASMRGLYPCGEGAGYAGGIMSAAVDGMRCAEAVLASYLSR